MKRAVFDELILGVLEHGALCERTEHGQRRCRTGCRQRVGRTSVVSKFEEAAARVSFKQVSEGPSLARAAGDSSNEHAQLLVRNVGNGGFGGGIDVDTDRGSSKVCTRVGSATQMLGLRDRKETHPLREQRGQHTGTPASPIGARSAS